MSKPNRRLRKQQPQQIRICEQCEVRFTAIRALYCFRCRNGLRSYAFYHKILTPLDK